MREFLSIGCIWIDLRVLVPIADALCSSLSNNFFEFLTEARNIGNRDEDIFLDFQASIWIYEGFPGFFSDSFIIKYG